MKFRFMAAFVVSAKLANAQNMSPDELKSVMAAVINSSGYLCAEVTDIRPLRMNKQFEVTCIEYRGGSGTVRYIFNGEDGSAFPATVIFLVRQ
ncbi:hypothetical protein [Mesorhizobium sp. M0520]|uniref:hypothetical protein n=1 Tax=Mesorhizobium sp. M0520 TaxID=2956957 RepID=UPI003335CDCC